MLGSSQATYDIPLFFLSCTNIDLMCVRVQPKIEAEGARRVPGVLLVVGLVLLSCFCFSLVLRTSIYIQIIQGRAVPQHCQRATVLRASVQSGSGAIQRFPMFLLVSGTWYVRNNFCILSRWLSLFPVSLWILSDLFQDLSWESCHHARPIFFLQLFLNACFLLLLQQPASQHCEAYLRVCTRRVCCCRHFVRVGALCVVVVVVVVVAHMEPRDGFFFVGN